MGVEKEYYADKEDAYKMRRYFKKEKKGNEKSIEISDDIKFEDIKDVFEEVDEKGEEIPIKEEDKKEEDKKEGEEITTEGSTTGKSKKHHKKKH